jgi:hypothetical protein
MKHAGGAALDRLEPLLAEVRAARGLKQKSRGVFYLKGKAFLHFHEDPAGLYADVRAADGAAFDRLKVDEPPGAAALVEQVRAISQPFNQP